MMNKIRKYISDPWYRFGVNSLFGVYNKLSDEEYIRLKWNAFYNGRKKLDLENPQTLCEKLQWYKLNYRIPEMTMMVDKFQAKEYVKSMVGEEYVIPTLGVWDKPENIDFTTLPDAFVLKVTHDSGGLVICRDKSECDKNKVIVFLNKYLKRNFYLEGREWPYKDVKPRIIAEPYIEGLGNSDSVEYKATCMNGKVSFVTICIGIAHSDFYKRSNDHFDRNFNKMDWYVNYKPAATPPKKPDQWDDLLDFCEKLCKDYPYIRIDCYIINGRILFGEFTFFTWAGFMHFTPDIWDLKLGQLLKLPNEKE